MKTRLFTFAALALALAACTNDNENLNDGPVAAVINAEISDAVATRASGTQWTTNDEIGISERHLRKPLRLHQRAIPVGKREVHTDRNHYLLPR